MNQLSLSQICESCSNQTSILSIGLPHFNPELFNVLDLNSYMLDHTDPSQATEFSVTTAIQLILTFLYMQNGVRIQANAIYTRPVDCTLSLQDKTISMVNYAHENRHADRDSNSLELFFNRDDVVLLDSDINRIELTPISKDNEKQWIATLENRGDVEPFLQELEAEDEDYSNIVNKLIEQLLKGEAHAQIRELMLKAYESRLDQA